MASQTPDQTPDQTSTRITLALMGNSGVGKTTYSTRFMFGEFIKNAPTCVDIEQRSQHYNTNQGPIELVVLEIPTNWDKPLPKSVQGVMVMFDMTNDPSFVDVDKYLSTIPKDLPIVIIGNKTDVEGRTVLPKFIQRTAKWYGSHPYIETSANCQYQIQKPFESLLKSIFKTMAFAFEQSVISPPTVE